jgi:cytoskeletal protein RodZ
MSNLFRYARPRHLAVVAVFVLCVTVLIFSVVLRNGKQPASAKSGDDTNTSSSAHTSPTEDASAQDDPKSLVDDRTAINDSVKAFVNRYYSLSPTVSAEKIRQSVKPFATRSFLQNATFGFGTSEADKAMIREGASKTSRAAQDFDGEFYDSKTVVGTVTLEETKWDRDHQPVLTFKRDQQLTLVKIGGRWLVQDAPST